jgi:hypothetical protein
MGLAAEALASRLVGQGVMIIIFQSEPKMDYPQTARSPYILYNKKGSLKAPFGIFN